jgi:hypothetical protein
MRRLTLIILIFQCHLTSGQNLIGSYKDYFGHRIQFQEDSTFLYEWRFDLVKTWATGNWKISNDTIYLNFITVYDTLKRENKSDTLVISIDNLPNSISEQEFAINSIISGGQKSDGITERLYIKGKRLYLVSKNGHLNKGKFKGLVDNKKYPTYYYKLD